jgi:glycosyltransferase involved in cell wall biosynthesis
VSKISLSILVPVYNEERFVEQSLSRLFALEQSQHLNKVQVMVVDDCSKDRSAEILKRFSEKVTQKQTRMPFEWVFIRHEKNRGKGKALQTALARATSDVTIIHDADLEYFPEDILRMIPVFINEKADAVYGSRFLSGEYRRVLFFYHQLGNQFLTFLTNMVTNLNMSDMETCYKAIRTELFKSIPIFSNDFRFEPEITIKLSKRRARVFEVPIRYAGRTYEEGKKINWVDGMKAVFAIMRFALSRKIKK